MNHNNGNFTESSVDRMVTGSSIRSSQSQGYHSTNYNSNLYRTNYNNSYYSSDYYPFTFKSALFFIFIVIPMALLFLGLFLEVILYILENVGHSGGLVPLRIYFQHQITFVQQLLHNIPTALHQMFK